MHWSLYIDQPVHFVSAIKGILQETKHFDLINLSVYTTVTETSQERRKKSDNLTVCRTMKHKSTSNLF